MGRGAKRPQRTKPRARTQKVRRSSIRDGAVKAAPKVQVMVLGMVPEERPVFKIPVQKIRVYKDQPRRGVDEASLLSLARSINVKGQKEPGVVRALSREEIRAEQVLGGQARFELISGERRLRACMKAGIPEFRAFIDTVLDPEDQFEQAMDYNFPHEPICEIDEARAYHRLKENRGLTNSDLAAKFGVHEITISHRLQLLKLHPDVMAMMEASRPPEKRLPVTVANEIVKLQPEAQVPLARRTLDEELTIKEVRHEIRKAMARGAGRDDLRRKRNPVDDLKVLRGVISRHQKDLEAILEWDETMFRRMFAHRAQPDQDRTLMAGDVGQIAILCGELIKRIQRSALSVVVPQE